MDMVSNWKMKKFWKWIVVMVVQGRPRWLSGKESTCQAGDTVWILGSGRHPGGGQGNPLQYSCLGNPMDRGDGQTMVHGVAKESDTTW